MFLARPSIKRPFTEPSGSKEKNCRLDSCPNEALTTLHLFDMIVPGRGIYLSNPLQLRDSPIEAPEQTENRTGMSNSHNGKNDLSRMWQEAELYEAQGCTIMLFLCTRTSCPGNRKTAKLEPQIVHIQFLKKMEETTASRASLAMTIYLPSGPGFGRSIYEYEPVR